MTAFCFGKEIFIWPAGSQGIIILGFSGWDLVISQSEELDTMVRERRGRQARGGAAAAVQGGGQGEQIENVPPVINVPADAVPRVRSPSPSPPPRERR